jgi:catechol-2,3-dioxygenase
MNLPDAPIAHEGFFATHFLTVRDQEKSKDFYVRILGGKVIKPEKAWPTSGTATKNGATKVRSSLLSR